VEEALSQRNTRSRCGGYSRRQRLGYTFGERQRRLTLLRLWFLLIVILIVRTAVIATSARNRSDNSAKPGIEMSITAHLRDGVENSVSLATLLTSGERLFTANWTRQEGAGRPRSKGTGRPLTLIVNELRGPRAVNRISGQDASSCASCHNAPFGVRGGSGDFSTSVFVLGQRFDSVTFDPLDSLPTSGTITEDGRPATLQTVANLRATTGMFGAGYLEMLARWITTDLQHTRDSIKLGETKELVSNGIHFGALTLTSAGLWDTSKVAGLGRLSLLGTDRTNPPSLVIRPWHQASNVVSLREFSNTAFN
jgi:hypothetical protein